MKRLLEVGVALGLVVCVVVSVLSSLDEEWAKATFFLMLASVLAFSSG